jgi:hypothetical protein
MLEENFNILLTFDKNLEFQQNFKTYPIAVFVLVAENNTYKILSELVSQIKKNLSEKPKVGVTRINLEK